MKAFKLVLLFLIATAIFFVIGQYAGLAAYFKITGIPFSYMSLDGLYNNWLEYSHDADIKPYLQFGVGVAAFTTLTPAMTGLLIFIMGIEREEIHGSAKLATDMDLTKSGMFPKNTTSPYLLLGKMGKGKFKNKFLKLEGQTFLGVSAPTGAGKGVSIVIPNLVNYSDSVVNLDLKLENFFKTAGFRQQQGQKVFLFAPDGYSTSNEDREAGILRSHKYNPYHYVRRIDEYRVGDLLIISNSLYPLSGDAKTDVWPASAGKLFMGLSLWMLDTESITKKTPTLPYLLSLIGVEGGLANWMRGEIKQSYLSQECQNEFNAYLSFPDETQGSVLLSLNSPLAILGDKTVASALSGNDFDFNDLRRSGISLYVGVQPPNKKRFQILLNLFFEQLINENTRVIPELDDSLSYQCLLLLDEFPALGRVNQIKESIGFTRQYNLRYVLIYQDYSQLADRSNYGQEGAANIVSNFATEIIYPPKEVNDRVKKISETLGTKTVKVESRSISRGKHHSRNTSRAPNKRAVMMPHEIVELGHKRHPTVDIGLNALMFKENQRSFVFKKTIYFEEEVLNERVEYSKANVPQIPLL